MLQRTLFAVTIAFFVFATINTGHAQPSSKSAASPAASSSTSSPASGIRYTRDRWSKSPPTGDDLRILCYVLSVTGDVNQPYALSWTTEILLSGGKKVDCAQSLNTNPLLMDARLAIAFDATKVDVARIHDITISVSTVAANPLSPTPIRPTMGGSLTTTNLSDQVYYLLYPFPLPGDVLPTLQVTATYLPPSQGEAWQSRTVYPPGSIVVPNAVPNGHYYETVDGGVSQDIEPRWNATQAASGDGNCSWQPIGGPAPQTTAPWKPANTYNAGDFVLSLVTGMTYVQTVSSCKSGNTLPTFVLPAAITREKRAIATGLTPDGTTEWKDTGSSTPGCKTTWPADADVKTNASICDPNDNDRTYTATKDGRTGKVEPDFVHAGVIELSGNPAIWKDLGQGIPSAVASASPNEQTPTLLNVPLPQTHSRYYYNLASGVVVTTIRTKSFGFPAGSTPTSNGSAMETGSSLLIDPVLFLTRYLRPFDAGRKEKPRDFIDSFGINVGFSLSAPTNNFYFGGTNELLRLVQVNYGFVAAKVPKLAGDVYIASGGSSTPTPITNQVFAKGGYIGLSFNISGLIQSVTGSGGSSSKGSSSSSQ